VVQKINIGGNSLTPQELPGEILATARIWASSKPKLKSIMMENIGGKSGPLTERRMCGIMRKKEKYIMKNKSFNWIDAILSIFLIIIGVILIGTAENNWFIALGVLVISSGVIQSERNRSRND
jgi:hypothetical protein